MENTITINAEINEMHSWLTNQEGTWTSYGMTIPNSVIVTCAKLSFPDWCTFISTTKSPIK